VWSWRGWGGSRSRLAARGGCRSAPGTGSAADDARPNPAQTLEMGSDSRGLVAEHTYKRAVKIAARNLVRAYLQNIVIIYVILSHVYVLRNWFKWAS